MLGRVNDRLPNWAGPLQRWAKSRSPLFAPKGGTAVTTAQTVAEITADALERASNEDIPIADENLTWTQLFARIAEAAGNPRKVHRLPPTAVRAAIRSGALLQTSTHREMGVTLNHAANLFLTELFVDPASGRRLDQAFRETFR